MRYHWSLRTPNFRGQELEKRLQTNSDEVKQLREEVERALLFRAIDGVGLLTAESFRGRATSAVVASYGDGQRQASA